MKKIISRERNTPIKSIDSVLIKPITHVPTESENLFKLQNALPISQYIFEPSMGFAGNQSIDQYLSVHKDSFSNPPTNRRIEEGVIVDCSKMMKFKAS
ncbi:hypothetical protein AVEN_51745-1 [Araneus ventricosus]|uniref:Uncharacterized protein n=1 Tax=Araneus ventricosus TaxID=182803 RepID=A0A4Y2K662_ARAVE|nr:hypothetical protein AVEN_51745-1 [Araneus ventricosus]